MIVASRTTKNVLGCIISKQNTIQKIFGSCTSDSHYIETPLINVVKKHILRMIVEQDHSRQSHSQLFHLGSLMSKDWNSLGITVMLYTTCIFISWTINHRFHVLDETSVYDSLLHTRVSIYNLTTKSQS